MAQVNQVFDNLKASYASQDWDACKQLLPKAKLQLVEAGAHGADQQHILQVSREVLELAVWLSVQTHDEAAFERNFQQLRAHYADSRNRLPPSPNEAEMTGLNLLRLLVQNRIAEFHTELEVIPSEVQGQGAVAWVVHLEQWLMEGAYNKVLATRTAVPAPSFSYFMDLLSSTVREEVADCSERAYSSLKVADAQRLLLFQSEQEAADFAAQRGWDVRDGRVHFQPQDTAGGHDVNAVELISNGMTYARELERIV